MNEVMKDVKHYLKTLYVALEGGPKSLDRQTLALAIGCVLFCILVDIIATFFLGFNYINDIALVVGTLIYIKFYLRPERKEFENLLEKTERKNKWKQKITKLKLSK